MNKKENVQITSQSIRKWREQKEQSRRSNLPPEEEAEGEPKKEDFPEMAENQARQINLKFDIETVQRIALDHPALAASNAFSEVLQQFYTALRPHFKSNQNQQLTELFNAYYNEIDRTIRQMDKERKGVISTLEPACVKDNPQDCAEKTKSRHYNILIRDKQQDYQRKLNLKDLYQQNLREEKEDIDQIISRQSGRVSEEVVRERFIPYYNSKMEENTRAICDSERKYHKQLVGLFRAAGESNRVEREKMKAMRRQNVKDRARDRWELCERMGNSLGQFSTLHDLFSYR